MKTIITVAVIFTTMLSACNNNTGEAKKPDHNVMEHSEHDATDGEKMYACPMHPEVTGKKGEKCNKCAMELTKAITAAPAELATDTMRDHAADVQGKFTTQGIINNYLQLKNALVKDDGQAAAAAGKELHGSFAAVNTATLTEQQKKEFADIAEDAQEHSEHIGVNAGKISHQREHFAQLSRDINDLVKTFGAPQTLYSDFCPMYNDNKGAAWISETKEIKNPYYGAQMMTCGKVQETFIK